MDDVLVGESFRIEELEPVKEERDSSLEEKNAYKMEKEKLKKTLLELKVAVKQSTSL